MKKKKNIRKSKKKKNIRKSEVLLLKFCAVMINNCRAMEVVAAYTMEDSIYLLQTLGRSTNNQPTLIHHIHHITMPLSTLNQLHIKLSLCSISSKPLHKKNGEDQFHSFCLVLLPPHHGTDEVPRSAGRRLNRCRGGGGGG